jgi:dihydropteroate synthase
VNDVSCLRNHALAEVVRDEGASLIIMHARGLPSEMHGPSIYPETGYVDVVSEVLLEWGRARDLARTCGLKEDAILMDPGLGFGKSQLHSWTLLRHTTELVRRAGAPVVVGASRKSFLKCTDEAAPARERLGASVAAALYAMRSGAAMVRVHDVRATLQALRAEHMLSHLPAATGNQAPAGPPHA